MSEVALLPSHAMDHSIISHINCFVDDSEQTQLMEDIASTFARVMHQSFASDIHDLDSLHGVLERWIVWSPNRQEMECMTESYQS